MDQRSNISISDKRQAGCYQTRHIQTTCCWQESILHSEVKRLGNRKGMAMPFPSFKTALLHWLSICLWVEFKVLYSLLCSLRFRAAAFYMLCYVLRSASKALLWAPSPYKTKLVAIGERNCLILFPGILMGAFSFIGFRCQTKTYFLFSQAFNQF